jgi:GNAT superfamily N-acetyltransferase
MRSAFQIRQATPQDADIVGDLVTALFDELYDPEYGAQRRPIYLRAAAELIAAPEIYAAFLAMAPENEALGVLTLSQCVSIYAGGRFGEINEFYVLPAARKLGLGRALIAAAAEEAARRGWPHLEVCTADLPRWQRSVDFYRSCGFTEVGLRLELEIDPG